MSGISFSSGRPMLMTPGAAATATVSPAAGDASSDLESAPAREKTTTGRRRGGGGGGEGRLVAAEGTGARGRETSPSGRAVQDVRGVVEGLVMGGVVGLVLGVAGWLVLGIVVELGLGIVMGLVVGDVVCSDVTEVGSSCAVGMVVIEERAASCRLLGMLSFSGLSIGWAVLTEAGSSVWSDGPGFSTTTSFG